MKTAACLLLLFGSAVTVPVAANPPPASFPSPVLAPEPDRLQAVARLTQKPFTLDKAHALVQALGDPSPRVRRAAAVASGVAHAYERVFQNTLKARPRGMRWAEYGPLYQQKRERQLRWQRQVVEALGRCALGVDEGLAREGLAALAELGREQPADDSVTVWYCGVDDESLKADAEDKLKEAANEIPARLFRLLDDRRAHIVSQMAAALRAADHLPLFPVLRRFLSDPRPEWRMIGVEGLSSDEEEDQAQIEADLMPLIADPDDGVRRAALVRIPDSQRLLAKLTASWPQPNPYLRRSFLTLLSWALDGPAFPRIDEAIEDSDPVVVEKALIYCVGRRIEVAPAVVVRHLEHSASGVRGAALSFTSRLPERQAVPLLIARLSDADAGGIL